MTNKPSIRLKFSDPSPTAPSAAVAKHPAQPARKSKSVPPTIGTEPVIVKCGHTIAFDLYAKDSFRDARRQKAVSRECPPCRQARVAADAAAAADRKAKKKAAKKAVMLAGLKPRLPDGARFAAIYDATATEWTGSLTVDGASFELRAGSIKKLLHRLDDAYRASLPSAAVAVESSGDTAPSAAS